MLKLNIYEAKLVIHWHADISEHKFLYGFYKKFEKKILLKANKIISTSKDYQLSSKQLDNFGYKIIILPNIVNENKFILQDIDIQHTNEIKKQFGNKKIIFFIGRHVHYKGIEFLLDAEQYIDNDSVIVIAGSGPLTGKLKQKSKNIGRIFFINRISDEVLKHYLYCSDVFAFPSHTRSEAFGVAMAEALYCGLPAVSFNIKGSGTNWVNKNNFSGYVVENKNVAEFAKAINTLLRDNTLHKQMGENAKLWIRQNFVKNNISTVLEQIYSPKANVDVADEKINVSIVLYNNDFAKIEALVESLNQNKKINKIFLIDNSKHIEKKFEKLPVCYIFNNQNIGYGRGHNIALNQTLERYDIPYHLVMNADISFNPKILDEIIMYMSNNQDVGSLMPKIFYPNGKIQYLCRLLPAPIDLIVRRFLPSALMKKRVRRLELRNTEYNQILNVPHISGCFMLLRVNVLRSIGLFDDRYFLYLEDVDLTRRILTKARTIFYHQVSIIHEHRQGSYNSIRLLFVHIFSAIKYFNKWGWLFDKDRKKINEQTINQLKTINNQL
jgi:GT2 family glycosyltransferase